MCQILSTFHRFGPEHISRWIRSPPKNDMSFQDDMYYTDIIGIIMRKYGDYGCRSCFPPNFPSLNFSASFFTWAC